MVISSLVVETYEGETSQARAALAALPGVEVHETVETRLVVTIEAETADDSAKIAEKFTDFEGVATVALIYVNFEDDPSLNQDAAADLASDFQE